jgi:hypothetical protein
VRCEPIGEDYRRSSIAAAVAVANGQQHSLQAANFPVKPLYHEISLDGKPRILSSLTGSRTHELNADTRQQEAQ